MSSGTTGFPRRMFFELQREHRASQRAAIGAIFEQRQITKLAPQIRTRIVQHGIEY